MLTGKQKVNDSDLTFSNVARRVLVLVTVAGLSILSACSIARAPDSTSFCPSLQEGAIAYVKRPLQFDEDNPSNLVIDDLREPQAFRPGARLFIKGSLLSSEPEHDITSAVFSDASFLNDDGELLYDVKDLAVSYDASKLAFAMRAPDIEGADDEDQPKWNLWLYDFEECSLSRVINSDASAEAGHDIAPAFLADDRLVFSSTRQQVSKGILLDEGKPQYSALDEERNVEAFNLHVSTFDGQQIDQISFNQSHDLNPVLRANGKLVFSRWDNAGQTPNNGMNLYEVNPDGTELNYLYGRHSHDSGTSNDAVQYARPVVNQDENVVVELRPFESAQLSAVPTAVQVDAFIEHDQYIDGSTGMGQQPLIDGIDTSGELHIDGNYGSIFPFYDGTGRLLASWSVCRVRRSVPMSDDPNVINTNLPEVCTAAKLADTQNYEPAPPLYGLWIVDGATKLPLVLPEEGQEFTDAVLLASRTSPTYIADATLGNEAQDLAVRNLGVLHIRSVYDIDGNDSSPSGIESLADPLQTDPLTRPILFARLEKPVSLPPEYVREFDNSAFGRSNAQLMREILGYVPVEPDGSVKVAVPANVPFSISLLDADGRRLMASERHQNWLSLKPGEALECKGCHSAASEVAHGRRGVGPDALNQGASTTGLAFPNTVPALFADAGETMAEVYARINGLRSLTHDIVFEDEWTDATRTPKAASFDYLYADLETTTPVASPACLATWESACRIVTNYPEHIQPLWSLDRRVFDVDGITVLADNTCTTCHNNEDDMGSAMVPVAQLDLSNDPSTDEPNHFVSYRNLLFTTAEQALDGGILQVVLVATGEFERNEDGDLILDGAGDPIEIFETIPVPPTMNTAGAARSDNFFSLFESGASHDGYLNASELRLISEWLDVGGQYWNDPFKAPLN